MADIRDMPWTRPDDLYDVENSNAGARHAPVLTTQEARQGETSGHVRIILHTSLVLAVIAAIILYVVYF